MRKDIKFLALHAQLDNKLTQIHARFDEYYGGKTEWATNTKIEVKRLIGSIKAITGYKKPEPKQAEIEL